jgi:hypothetical protein
LIYSATISSGSPYSFRLQVPKPDIIYRRKTRPLLPLLKLAPQIGQILPKKQCADVLYPRSHLACKSTKLMSSQPSMATSTFLLHNRSYRSTCMHRKRTNSSESRTPNLELQKNEDEVISNSEGTTSHPASNLSVIFSLSSSRIRVAVRNCPTDQCSFQRSGSEPDF